MLLDEVSNRPFVGRYVVENMGIMPQRYRAARRPPTSLRKQAAQLRTAKRDLEGAYMQEEAALGGHTTQQEVAHATAVRARTERRYVNALLRYLRNTNSISGQEAGRIQMSFTRQRMEGMGSTNKAYLRSMFPRELA